MRRSLGRLAGSLAAAALTTGCVLGPNALDGPIAVPLTVTPTPTSIGIEAPTWRPGASRIYLCPFDPPALPDPGPARIGWSPGETCFDYGSWDSHDGLRADLPTEVLVGASGGRFAASPDWWVLILEVDGERVVQGVRSRFGRPDGWPVP